MSKKIENVTLDCELIDETPKAYKVEVLVGKKKRKQFWAAKSVSEIESNKNGSKITLPQWLAEKEELL